MLKQPNKIQVITNYYIVIINPDLHLKTWNAIKLMLEVAEAIGRLKVCVSPLETILKFVPLVPVVINCDWSVRLFKETIPFDKVVTT